MCFDRDSLPPIPAISGASVSHESSFSRLGTGTAGSVRATPDEPSGTGVVILPTIRGLYRFYEELALRARRASHAAIAIDTSAAPPACRSADDEFEYRPAREQTTPAGVRDTADGVAWLREAWLYVDLHGRVLLRRAPLLARRGRRSQPRGSGSASNGRPPRCGWLTPAGAAGSEMVRRSSAMAAPSPASRSTMWGLRAGARDRRREHEIVIYDGASAKLLSPQAGEFADASADAWSRVLGFIERYSAPPAVLATGSRNRLCRRYGADEVPAR